MMLPIIQASLDPQVSLDCGHVRQYLDTARRGN